MIDPVQEDPVLLQAGVVAEDQSTPVSRPKTSPGPSLSPPTSSLRYEWKWTAASGVPSTCKAPALRFAPRADVPTSMLAAISFNRAPESIITVTPCGTISPAPSASGSLAMSTPSR